MRQTLLKTLFAIVTMALISPAFAASKEEKRVGDAADVLDQLLRIPEKTIPPALLARAYAVAVIPDVVKVGFGLGARRGKGILVVRQDDDSWSNPAFITLTGGSIGWQIGAQSTDIILVFKTRKGVDNLANGKLTLGADASIAAGQRLSGLEDAIAVLAESKLDGSRVKGVLADAEQAWNGITQQFLEAIATLARLQTSTAAAGRGRAAPCRDPRSARDPSSFRHADRTGPATGVRDARCHASRHRGR